MWHLKTVVILHWCLIRAVLFVVVGHEWFIYTQVQFSIKLVQFKNNNCVLKITLALCKISTCNQKRKAMEQHVLDTSAGKQLS